MLGEADVINAVCDMLRRHSFEIVGTCTVSERGDDIRALAPDGSNAYVEAKGETSSNASTIRFGKPFNSGQVTDHVAKALLRSCRGVGRDQWWAMAFPDNDLHQREVNKILPALAKLGIEVFWVSPDKSVRRQGLWPDSFFLSKM
jgi:hypothetical protein